MGRTGNGIGGTCYRVTTTLILALCIVLLSPSFSRTEGILDELCAALETREGYSADVFVTVQSAMPYDERRTGMLNDLLKHLSLGITKDGSVSRTTVYVDEEPAYSVTAKDRKRVYSFDPETVYEIEGEQTLSGGLEDILLPDPGEGIAFFFEHFTADRLMALTDGFEALGRIPEKLPEYAKDTYGKNKIKNAGTAVKKVSVTLKKADTEAGYMTRTTGGFDNPFLSKLLGSLTFENQQRFTLFYDEAGILLKADYSGQTGTVDDQRKVTLTWTRSATGNEEKLVVKAQPLSGSNRDVLQVTRTEDETSLVLDFEYDRTRNKSKMELSGNIALRKEDTVNLEAEIISKRDGDSEKLVLNGTIDYESASSWKAETNLTFNRNKKTTLDGTLSLRVKPGSEVEWLNESEALILTEGTTEYEAFRKKMASALLLPVLRLPADDILFLTEGLE